jgi:hypothetical protein
VHSLAWTTQALDTDGDAHLARRRLHTEWQHFGGHVHSLAHTTHTTHTHSSAPHAYPFTHPPTHPLALSRAGKMNRGLSVLNTFQHLIGDREPTAEVSSSHHCSLPPAARAHAHTHRRCYHLRRQLPSPNQHMLTRLPLPPLPPPPTATSATITSVATTTTATTAHPPSPPPPPLP